MKIQSVYKPEFEIKENNLPGISDKKVGQKVGLNIKWEMIEKTKNYIVLKVSGISLVISRRSF